MRRVTNRATRVLLGLVILSTLITPFQRQLFVGDETKYSQVVREMRSGSFFLPTLQGTPFTHKPPLHFWIVDLLTYPLGLYSIWPFVLPSLLAFVALLWLLARMEGPLASFVCGTSLMVWGSAQTARMDVGFTALLVLGAWLLQQFWEGERRALLGSGAAFGLATLLKGPMALVIAIALFLFERIRRKSAPRGPYALAILLMAAIPLLWFVPAMIQGGNAYTEEVLVKQTAGRAVGSWVHKAAPWYYLTRAPGTLFPWLLILVVAVIAVYKRSDERARFYVSWILAVLVPYSLLSSKLDVYMMALIPPVSLLIGRFLKSEDVWSQWGRAANLFTMGFLLLVGLAGLLFAPRLVKGPEQALTALPQVKGIFVTLVVAAIAGLIVAWRSRSVVTSTLAAGMVPLVMFAWIGIFAMPVANSVASTEPLVRVLQKEKVAPENVALHASPHLWIRGMPRELERVRYVNANQLRGTSPQLIVTSRKYAPAITDTLRGYRHVGEFRMIGKPFDVYRR